MTKLERIAVLGSVAGVVVLIAGGLFALEVLTWGSAVLFVVGGAAFAVLALRSKGISISEFIEAGNIPEEQPPELPHAQAAAVLGDKGSERAKLN